MDPKSAIVKSKSSNSGISKSWEGKKQKTNKKSRSNAEFPLNSLKKRGVYVEKTLTKIHLANDRKVDILTKKQPIKRAGQKKILASVLTILSKSTTGTQYPEADDDERKQKEATAHEQDKKNKNKPCAIRNRVKDEADAAKRTINKRNDKEIFKSLVLSKKFLREDNKKMVVLQSRKEIAQTPSNYSEWSSKDASHRSNTSNYLVYDDSDINGTEGRVNIADDLKNAILEGRNFKKVKKLRYLDDDPKTLVSEGPKDQKNLYNFFVDLLERTISVYNVKTEYNALDASDVSKIDLQINESVANKLNIGQDTLISQKSANNINVYPSKLFDVENELNNEDMIEKPIIIKPSRQELRFKNNKLKKLKRDSFIYPNKIKPAPKTSKSVEINRKTKFKSKNDLINVLKQELETGNQIFEEPKSIFQALKVMARNKKKISFYPKTFTDECIMKRRRIIPYRKNQKYKKQKNQSHVFNKPIKSFLDNRDYKLNYRQKVPNYNINRQVESNNVESWHSLEVFGVDYESNKLKGPNLNHANDITLTYHSSNSELDFDLNDAILNPASQYSSLRQF